MLPFEISRQVRSVAYFLVYDIFGRRRSWWCRNNVNRGATKITTFLVSRNRLTTVFIDLILILTLFWVMCISAIQIIVLCASSVLLFVFHALLLLLPLRLHFADLTYLLHPFPSCPYPNLPVLVVPNF